MDEDSEKAEERQPPALEGNHGEGEENHPGDNPPTDERFQFNDNLWKRVRKEESKKGIVYLADVPIGLTASRLREIFSHYGTVNRIHLNRTKDEGEEEGKGFLSSHMRKKDGKNLGEKKKKKNGQISRWDNFLWSEITSSALYRRMSRKDKLTHALKDMYKGYEAYVEKNGGSYHGKVRSGGIQKGDRPQNRKKEGPHMKRSVCPLRFVTVKKGEETKKVPLEVSHEEPPSLRRNNNAVSADLLKMLM
ncbi:Uncharacterized protein PCOAH_00004600 [Plasmodium coatneyi]|uniref:RRM domain-containing protein n=1 Tax=Plasmodium coatneyi TaxID=208452 RepID=A0A1B1DTW4_9APIC|nr:Uncharacterized protein PCOAH_00004600 [Plasmodium coatneyi]ANQ06184.1 Uncharacterized protein PCOAH_00004600 [Plasmodium coatneyi]